MTSLSVNSKGYNLRDHTGRELTISRLENLSRELESVNIYGNGLIGRVDVSWRLETVEPPHGEPYSYWARSDRRNYYIKDHLGSIRLTFNQDGQVVNAQDYYPFGERIRYVTGDPYNDRYKFTEKERDLETGYDYFGARYYDSELGRWLSVDPLAANYPGWSPYNYTLNNPVNAIDPNGEYTVKVASNGIVYQQWTLSGARAQLKLESFPSLSGFAFFENRVGRNDDSFKPTSSERRDKFLSTIIGGLYFPSGLLSTGYDLLQDVKHGDQLALMADEYAFNMALKNKEAVKACLNSDGSASWFPGGDKTTIMMHPELRKEYKNEKEANKYFKGQLNKYRDDFYNSTVNKSTNGKGFSDPDAERIRQSMYGNN